MSDTDQVVLGLLTALCESWTDQFTYSEIGSDLEKIKVLESAREALYNVNERIPEVVRELYYGVYLRDVWSNQGASSPTTQ